MSITIHLEIGHDACLRTKTTPEGFTHDWEVYVKGCNSAEIHYYVEKVVFHLHETFPKPKRVIKIPPYSLRTSGYAGFNLPIEIYLKNNQEPKKIKFNYDLQLQPTGPPIHKVQKEKFVFHSPSEEFRSKLLKGGGTVGSSGSIQDTSENKTTDEKTQMMSKPKLAGSDVTKKHKIKLEEPRNTDFLNLFGTPITKTTNKTPEPPKQKDVSKSSSKSDKPMDKDKSKTKSPHKEKEKEKSKDKENTSDSSEKRKEDKKKSKEDRSRDRERSKEKSSKRDKEREKSPSARPRSPSPKRSPKRPMSSPPPKHSSSKEKDQSKEEKKEKERKEDKKNKKEKREHKDSKHKDRDKEKEHKEHKSRESKSSKESNVKEKEVSPTPAPTPVPPPPPPPSQSMQKTEKKVKEKESIKEAKEEEKSEKSRQEKSEEKQKHKHKKKDRKEKREDKHSKSEKKSDRQSSTTVVKEELKEPAPVTSSRDIDKSNLFGSPKSDPPSTPNQSELKSEKPTNNLVAFRDDETSNDSIKVSSREPSPVPRAPSKSPSPPPAEPIKKPEPEKKKEELPKKKEKKEKKKDKKSDRDYEKRRKRKSPVTHVETEQPPEKILKEEENNNSDDERKVSSTEDANPLPKNEAEDYMSMLRDLQHKIMGLKDNSDLQKVVQLIAETGRYEVSAHTFDFDLCLLDRSTVRQLQDFFSSIS